MISLFYFYYIFYFKKGINNTLVVLKYCQKSQSLFIIKNHGKLLLHIFGNGFIFIPLLIAQILP